MEIGNFYMLAGGFTLIGACAAVLIVILIYRKLYAPRTRRESENLLVKRTVDLNVTNKILKQAIVERMKTEDALRESEERYRTLAESSPVGIWQITCEGRTIYANPEMRVLLEVESDDDLGGREYKSFFSQESLRTIEAEKEKQFLGSPSMYEAEIVGTRGGRLSVIVSSAPLIGSDGEIHSLIGMFVDITEKKRAEEELRKIREHLVQLEKLAALGELSSGIAHELNQPLNHIYLTCQLIERMCGKREVSGEELSADLSVIMENVNRAGSIIRGMRDFARKETSDPVPVDVRKAIENAVLMFGSQLVTRNISLTISAPPRPVMVLGSINRLGQVFVNLVSNARDSFDLCYDGRKKTINIDVFEEGERVVIKVRDNGAGIPEDILPEITRPFFTTKEHGRGTGLGMSISQRIIQEFGGDLVVESEVGVGTVMTVVLKRV